MALKSIIETTILTFGIRTRKVWFKSPRVAVPLKNRLIKWGTTCFITCYPFFRKTPHMPSGRGALLLGNCLIVASTSSSKMDWIRRSCWILVSCDVWKSSINRSSGPWDEKSPLKYWTIVFWISFNSIASTPSARVIFFIQLYCRCCPALRWK